jgi:hypothetical protein
MRLRGTPLGVIATGLVAGAAGTAVMTAFQLSEQRLRASADGAEQPPASWDEAPAPVGERVVGGVLHRDLDLDQAATVTNVVHWSYGTLLGAAFGILQSSFRLPVIAAASGFGTLVWSGDYAILPALGSYRPAWRYPVRTLALDLARHLVYGAGVAVAFTAVDHRTGWASGRGRDERGSRWARLRRTYLGR